MQILIITSYFKLVVSHLFSKERCPILKQYSFYFHMKSVVGLYNLIKFLILNLGRKHDGTGHKIGVSTILSCSVTFVLFNLSSIKLGWHPNLESNI